MPTDNKLFTGTASYYAKYRPPYPQAFFDYVDNYFSLDGKGNLLDLGCGPGSIAIPFSGKFEKVVGVDPEQEMLDEAKIQAKKVGAKNIEWVLAKAEDIAHDLGRFRLTTIGAAFHWMDQKKVLDKIYELTESGGGVAIVDVLAHTWKYDDRDDPWKRVYKDLVRKYLGERRRAGDSFYKKTDDFEESLDKSPFGSHQKWAHDFKRQRTTEDVIGFLFSTSFASRRLFGDKVNDFEEKLKRELLKIEPTGIFSENVSLEALVSKKI